MKTHRSIVLCLALLAPLSPAFAQITFSFGSPGAHVGITLNAYPTLQRIPGYPVYYAPSMRTNYFFYDGLYWLFEGDGWYASSWYNGPWHNVEPWDVPVYVLRVPVRYYRHPPTYFHGWSREQPPRWGDHYGASFEQRRSGWDRWDRNAAPPPAPLPSYQRQYSGTRYPDAQQQATILTQKYRYQPQDPVATQHFQQQRAQVQSQPQAPREQPRQVEQKPQSQQPQQQPQRQQSQQQQQQQQHQQQQQIQAQQPKPQAAQRQQPQPQVQQQPQAQQQPQSQRQPPQAKAQQHEPQGKPQAQQHEPQGKPQAQGQGKVKNAPEHDDKENKGKGKGQD